MGTKVPGLGKATGQVGFDAHLEDGQYLIEAVSCREEKKPKGGRTAQDATCPFQYVIRTNILGGPDQKDGESPAGRPWTIFLYIDPDHEYTELMANRLKDALNAFGVTVRADAFKEADLPGQRAVMVIANKMQDRGPNKGEFRSEIVEFLSVEESEYAGKAKK